MALTALEINRAATDGKPLKLPDGSGLYVYVTTKTKSYRTDYRIGGRRGTVVHGQYPAMTLSQARERNREAKQLLAGGIDPATHKNSKNSPSTPPSATRSRPPRSTGSMARTPCARKPGRMSSK
ncbi:Arm DNA-binding domain-containing protein [Paraburkholderia sp.]|uniref:Arm DNA-binding domain-containing protein n=1 Tax=Paraburkholderia sp. TaxID=1926495 RepID=UPI003A522638